LTRNLTANLKVTSELVVEHRAWNLCATLFLALWLAGPSMTEAADNGAGPVGVLKDVTGTATVLRNGHSSRAAKADKVFLHDRFTTGRGSTVKIVLNGGGELDVGESSTLTIDEHSFNFNTGTSSTLIALLAGKLHSIVPFASGKTTFNLRTGNAVCGVRGTEFDTAYIVGKPCPGFPKCLRYTDVGVQRGVVEVQSATNPKARPVQVTAGYETTVPCEIPPSSPSPLGASELELPGYH
jgi:FecR protein